MKKKFAVFLIIIMIPIIILSCALLESLNDPLEFTKHVVDAAAPIVEASKPIYNEEEYYIGREVGAIILSNYKLYRNNALEKYLNLIQSDKRLLLNFINEISNKSQHLSKRIWFNFTNKTIEEKILSYIKENTTNGIIKFLPNISALAKQFEVTRPALSREISNLCKEKILTKIENNLYSVDFQQISQRNV